LPRAPTRRRSRWSRSRAGPISWCSARSSRSPRTCGCCA
jgi:hypothetical protein